MCAACIIRTKKSESHWQLLQILSIMLSAVKGGFGQNILTQFIEKLINFRDLYSFLNKIMWNFKCVKIFRKKWLFIEKYDELWDMFENRSKGYHHNSYIASRHSNGIEFLHEKGIIIRQYCKIFDIFPYYTLLICETLSMILAYILIKSNTLRLVWMFYILRGKLK